MFSALSGALTNSRSASVRLKSFRSRDPMDETIEHKNKVIDALTQELTQKDALLANFEKRVRTLETELMIKNASPIKRSHQAPPVQHLIEDGQDGIAVGRMKARIGTRGSLSTSTILQNTVEEPRTSAHLIAEKFVRIFQNPLDYVEYLQSSQFVDELTSVCTEVGEIFEEEPRCVFLQSPVYVFGDIHGNLEDLHFFADNIWKLGMDLTAGQFLFLGDYVDRGFSCLECVAYLFGLKILYPKKVTLLRGNHETRDVNGWEEHYKAGSFLYQCKERFGVEVGETVYEEVNQAFDRLPLSAVVDNEIFCVHGGIPRMPGSSEVFDNEIQAIMAVPNLNGIMPCYDHEPEWSKQLSADIVWSDPASEEMEKRLGPTGFGSSPRYSSIAKYYILQYYIPVRGGGAICFGSKAIDNFLDNNGLSYIIRAHEAHAHGVSLSKGARVFTVFSTSKDHKQGAKAMAGCILIDVDSIKVINRSPKYKNKYVHRRTSVSLANLSAEDLENRKKLGLVRFSIQDPEYVRASMEWGKVESKDVKQKSDDEEKSSSYATTAKPKF